MPTNQRMNTNECHDVYQNNNIYENTQAKYASSWLCNHATCVLLYMFSFTYEILAYLCKFIKLFLRIQGCFHLTLPFTTQNWSLECQCNISPAKCTWTKYTSNSFIFRCYMRHIYFIHIMQQSVKLPTINVSWEFNDFFPCPLIVTLIDLPLELCIWGTT